MTRRRLVVAAIIVDDLARPQRLLGACRSTPAELRGRWELPGGKVEPGEDEVTALVREVEEELGVTVRVGPELPGPDGGCWPISGRYELRCWFVTPVRGRPRPLGSHDRIRWLAPAELATVDWLDADRPIAAALRDLLTRSRPEVAGR